MHTGTSKRLFFNDDILVVCENQVFKQSFGIPKGRNCDILLANLHFPAMTLKTIFMYNDDVSSFNNDLFIHTSIRSIPLNSKLKAKTPHSLTYLLQMYIEINSKQAI